MLLLAHHEHETIILETSDGPIEVRLSRLDGDRPRIGIDAPKCVRIIRKEIDGEGKPGVASDAVDQEEEGWWHHPDELAAGATPEPPMNDMSVSDWDEEMLD